jgi:pimeloyl-ACP methyl ester carboxylesterase
VDLPDGRVMLLREYGDPAGTAVIALHGTPASRIMYALAAARAETFGLRIIAPDRWGYGGTSRHPRPTLAAFAQDAAVAADQLELARFGVLGVSGGGPYSVALAACLGDRVRALALVAPVGPIAGVDGVQLDPFHRFCFRVLPRVPGALRLVFSAFRRGLAASPAAAMRIAMLRAPPPDLKVIAHEEVHKRFVAMIEEGLRPGTAGAVTDMQLFSRPWNDVPLERVTAPCALWIGTVDNNVPIDPALRLAGAIPGCRLIKLVDEGHLWVALNYDCVLAWIAENMKGAASATPSP